MKPRNSFQELVTSRALSIAKSLGHEEADRQHVLVAMAETVLAGESYESRRTAIRAELPAKGNSYKTPTLSEAGASLIETCKNEEEALVLLGEKDAPNGDQFAVSESGETPPAPTVTITPKIEPSVLLAQLDGLIGLSAVKQQLRKVISVVEANRVRVENGDSPVPQSLHLVFTGNPGTGKTTVARIVAQLYGATGALKGDKFKEATRSDLVAQYVGHTAQQTERIIKAVKPGVLFIDEAYALQPSHQGDFAEECIATMVKGMEDFRGEFAVIAAGYRDEMKGFISSNPGLRSRFQTFIHFDDYSSSELLEIYRRFAQEARINLGKGVERRVELAVENAAGHEGFGNARFVRALWEETYANMALRAAEDGVTPREELQEVQSVDVPDGGSSASGAKRKKIGF
jgi:stage V sporulation protein K